ncbi:MAG TPA: zf-HC2 domain-containing protein [Actinocrinis sp.]|nr:zf-HC2 domain-containing protein [Actinocrinis sp.]
MNRHSTGSGAGGGLPPGPPGTDAAFCSPEQRVSLGSYALGALDPPEADQVRRHLLECPACRAEYRELAAVPAVLARITETEMAAGPVPPGGEMLARLLERAAAREGSFAVGGGGGAGASGAGMAPSIFDTGSFGAVGAGTGPGGGSGSGRQGRTHGRRRASVRQSSRALAGGRFSSPLRKFGLALAGAGLAAAAVAGVYAVTSSPAGAPSKTITAMNKAMGISGSVSYKPTEWGSWVQVTMHNVPPGDDCSLVAVDSKGDRAVASSWWAPSSGTATIPGGVAMDTSDIVKFQVVTSTGTTLLDIPVGK